MKYCTQCGSEQDDQAAYCSFCGERIVSADYNIDYDLARKKRHKTLCWIGIGVGITLIICMVLFFQISRKQNGHSADLSKERAQELIEVEFLVLMNYEESTNPLIEAICNSFNVEIEQIEMSEDDAIITCVVSNHSVEEAIALFEKTFDQQSSDSFQNILAECFERSSVLQRKLELVCIKVEHEYVVQLSEQELDACTGGLLSYYSKLVAE